MGIGIPSNLIMNILEKRQNVHSELEDAMPYVEIITNY